MEYMGKTFRPVSMEEFFRTAASGDVHPHHPHAWDNEKGYITEWETRTRELVGLSWGGTHLTKWQKFYFVPS